jgi:hypothetical protein
LLHQMLLQGELLMCVPLTPGYSLLPLLLLQG